MADWAALFATTWWLRSEETSTVDLVLQLLGEGDTLKATCLDRLSRSVLHLVTLGADLKEREIGLHVIEQGIDTATSEGRAMFGMLSVLAELQRELIVANTMDGLASARARGRVGGRDCRPIRRRWSGTCTTPGPRPSSRSPTCSASHAPRCTGTSARRPRCPASRRRLRLWRRRSPEWPLPNAKVDRRRFLTNAAVAAIAPVVAADLLRDGFVTDLTGRPGLEDWLGKVDTYGFDYMTSGAGQIQKRPASDMVVLQQQTDDPAMNGGGSLCGVRCDRSRGPTWRPRRGFGPRAFA